eukprot:Em0356g3a
MFQCPICEQNTSIQVGGASVLPQNLHLGFEVEVAGYKSKMTSNSDVACDQCAEGSSDPAMVFCCACHHFLCTFCLEHHKRNRIVSKHKIVGLDQEGARQLHATMRPGDHYCSQPNHEDNKLNSYCETCSLQEISTVAKTHQMEISGALEDAKEKKTLLSELVAISLSKTTALTLQKEQFEKMVGDIGHYTDMASQILQTHKDHEIVALGRLIPTELQATLRSVQTISLTPNQHSNISVSVKTDDLVRQLSKLGEIIVFFPSPSSCTWMSTSVAKVRTRYLVKVQSKTSKGEEYPHGGIEVKGEMRSKTHNGAVVYGEVEDHRDGTYTITLIPQTVGPHQLLITMDGKHSRCKVFSKEGVYVRMYGDPNGPRGLAIDDEGYSLVSENSGHCLSIYDPEGNKIHKVGNLKNPYGTALDPRDGSVFIANYVPNTVLKYCVNI